jgi:transcriptional regulator with XRE-family HTH domain
MTTSRLPNYIRTYRKRSCLTQQEVAFLLGSRSGAGISRHERFKQTPDLQTLLAYEMLFRTPLRSLFIGTHEKVEKKLLHRIRLLIRKLSKVGKGRTIAQKIELLTRYLEERVSISHAG